MGYRKAVRFCQAALEALSNARRYVYSKSPGRIKLRFRVGAENLRIEVEDEGAGKISKKTISKPNSGFDVMRKQVTRLDVRQSSKGGIIVSLILENKPISTE